jgi:hypothetical protein
MSAQTLIKPIEGVGSEAKIHRINTRKYLLETWKEIK